MLMTIFFFRVHHPWTESYMARLLHSGEPYDDIWPMCMQISITIKVIWIVHSNDGPEVFSSDASLKLRSKITGMNALTSKFLFGIWRYLTF